MTARSTARRRLTAVAGPMARILAAGIVFLAATAPVAAHRRTSGPVTGIAIESISHGEMAVFDIHRRAIFARAAARPLADEPFRRVLNYARIQYAFCLWGLVPGSIADEASPFNECAHAYLAAARNLLARMRAAPDADAATRALGERVDRDLLHAGVLAVCAYSADAFNTADVIRPQWAEVTTHPPTLAAFGGLAAAGMGMVLALVWSRSARPAAPFPRPFRTARRRPG